MGEITNFNLRKVTDFALTGIQSYDQLNLPPGVRDLRFTQLVADTLAANPIVVTDQDGAYFRLHTPYSDGKPNPVAVKVFRYDNNGFDIAREQLKKADELQLEEFFHTNPNLVISGKDKNIPFHGLTETEQILVLLAYEQLLHEELYPGYVLPAVFVSFPAKTDVVDLWVVADDLPEFQWHKNVLIKAGRLSSDGREILVKRGETAIAMVQNFELLSKSIFMMCCEEFTESQIGQLNDFAHLVQEVFERTGYYPDPSMDHPQSRNLTFSEGKLVLIDTNSIRYMDNHRGELRIVTKMLNIVKDARKLKQ
ncbi:MAG: hypothetical protein UT26_C0061G0006 [Microgenomates group bacterium GW2011_GWC1_39_12]|nr:MAG: hypothetical protein UT26_C0061G0006 [Microgenomates group bacterium GW2011_GWC1_39_12]